MNVLMIDNFDSFTYNLVDEIEKLDCNVSVYRNNIEMEALDKLIAKNNFGLIVISPGPSSPKNSGICIPLIKKYYKYIPLFGVCLGFQCIVEAFGGEVNKCAEVFHGKSSIVEHNSKNLFENIQSPIHIGRYHSLYANKVPEGFIVASQHNDIPMAIYHEKYNISGLQFHPESILTSSGSEIIKNVLRSAKDA